MFSTKDKIPSFLKSMVVFKFVYASCNACYVVETAIHLLTRIKEHLKTDKKSHIYQHLPLNENYFNSCTDDCFSILDYASTKYQLKIKEALYIKWLDSILNKQKKTYTMHIGRYIFLRYHSFSFFLPSTNDLIARLNNSLIIILILFIYIYWYITNRFCKYFSYVITIVIF